MKSLTRNHHNVLLFLVLFWFRVSGVQGLAFRSSSMKNRPLDVTGSLISNLAEIAIKLRLADQTTVKCEVSAPSSSLIQGRLGPVRVRGRGWRSGLGLSCRVIDATVQSCELDIGRVVTDQKLVLTQPAEGKCMIALNSQDFCNFIAHPLMRPAKINGKTIVFLTEKAHISSQLGSVMFYVQVAGQKWECTLERLQTDQGTAKITATPVDPKEDTSSCHVDATDLSQALTKFFNELTYELDGTFLSYRDMMVTDKGSAPSVMLALTILVRKFPSPGVDF